MWNWLLSFKYTLVSHFAFIFLRFTFLSTYVPSNLSTFIHVVVAYLYWYIVFHWLPWWLRGKESACNAGELGLIPGLGRSPRGGHGNPLQYSSPDNPHGQRILAGYSPWGRKESDTTEWLSTQHIAFHSVNILLFTIFSNSNSGRYNIVTREWVWYVWR